MNKLIFALILSFTFSNILAQDIKIQASVQRTTVALEQHFSYTVEVSGKSTGLPSPDFPEFKDFNLLSAPSTSTNMQWVNGKMTASNSTTVFLQPRSEGTFTIPAAMISYRGKTYSSNKIKIKVVKSSASNSKAVGTKKSTDSEISGQDLYIKTLVSKRKPYLGEQIVVTYKLYFRAQVRGYNFEKMPAFPGFWQEEFELPRQPVIESEVVNGVNYNTAILRKSALFPTQTGILELDPMKVSLEAVVQSRRSRRSLFDSFFDDPFGRTVKKIIETKAIKIDVKELPALGKPDDFSGAVGDYKFRATVDKRTAETNKAISLKLQLRGAGNIKIAELPNVSIPVDIEQYEPKISTNITKDGGIVRGTKNSEIILIPRIAGEYKLKPVSFSYFNPSTKKYETIVTKPIQLKIKSGKKNNAVSAVGQSGLSRQEVALLGKDIRYIKEFTAFTELGYKPYLSSKVWLAIFLMLVLFMAFISWDERQARISGDERLVRNRRAGKHAAKQLAKAKTHLNDENKSTFFKALSLALQGFVRDKLSIELTEFSAVNINNVLTKRGIPPEEIREYQDVLQESDYKQYAESSSSDVECKELYERAKTILTRLEKWI